MMILNDCFSAVNLVLCDPGLFDRRRCRDGGRVKKELYADAEAQRSGWKSARPYKPLGT